MKFRNEVQAVRLYERDGMTVEGVVRVQRMQFDTPVAGGGGGRYEPLEVRVERAGESRRLPVPSGEGTALGAAVVAAPIASMIIARLLRRRRKT
jgi:hypothetical protein